MVNNSITNQNLQVSRLYIILFSMIEDLTKTLNDNSCQSPGSSADGELSEMLKAGVHLGHAKSKNHTSMLPYIFGVRNTVAVIDLVKTQEKLEQAVDFIKKTVSGGGMVLLVGTKPGAKKLIQEVAEKTGMPYLIERWIGGSLTNFKVITKRVEYMENLEKEKISGGFEKYTKRERLKKDEQIEKLKHMFNGLRLMKKVPDVVFIADVNQDRTAVSEAKKTRIPVAALVDTNSDNREIDWPIPSNDDALPALRFMLGRIERAISEGLSERQSKAVE